MADTGFRERAQLLLANLREGREVRAYLDQFSAAGEGCFAVIKVGGALMAEELDALADRLTLLQALGLRPVVVFGAGPQLDARLTAAGLGTERRDGLRVTPPPAMPIVADETARTGLLLAEAMATRGGRAVLAPPGALTAVALDEEAYGRVGRVASVDTDAFAGLLASGLVPLVGPAHLDAEARLLNVNADDVAQALALSLRPLKIVFLTGTGGMMGADGRLIDTVNLATDWASLRDAPFVQGGMRVKLDRIADLLGQLPLSSSVSMTDVGGMVRELFTHGGSGTLIRQGERIVVEEAPPPGTYAPLIERAFGQPLAPDYWDRVRPLYAVRTERTRAAAIVTDGGPVHVLDKFAVDPSARGEGLAKAVWGTLRARSPNLVWRSRAQNPFNAFYDAQADGFLRAGFWHVYWHGLELDAALKLGRQLAEAPPDFGAAA